MSLYYSAQFFYHKLNFKLKIDAKNCSFINREKILKTWRKFANLEKHLAILLKTKWGNIIFTKSNIGSYMKT